MKNCLRVSVVIALGFITRRLERVIDDERRNFLLLQWHACCYARIMNTRMMKLVTICLIAGASMASSPATSPSPAPAGDLGKDVMKPMSALLKTIKTNITDGTKNPDTIANIKKIQDLVAVAAVTVPQTKSYAAAVQALGVEGALAKYQGMLRNLDTVLANLSALLVRQGSSACGSSCDDLLKQVAAVQSDGHHAFRD
jgi:hypothetical protein